MEEFEVFLQAAMTQNNSWGINVLVILLRNFAVAAPQNHIRIFWANSFRNVFAGGGGGG